MISARERRYAIAASVLGTLAIWVILCLALPWH
jgi:hypothetical protein